MKRYNFYLIVFCVLSISVVTFSQQERKDKAGFVKYSNAFLDTIRKSTEEFQAELKEKKEVFQLDISGMDLPESKDEFKSYWITPPVSQGLTGTCWDFSTTSFYESEVKRLYNKELKLSEMFTAYWEYVEKAKRFVKERGNSLFAEGSEANAVPRIWKKYGIVPEESYSGLQPGQEFHDHGKMFEEMNTYLKSVKAANAWNEHEVIETIKDIMNHYIGEPPVSVSVNGEEYTPQEYLAKVVKLNLDDYVDVLSLMEKPYWEQVEYTVPDNWWHNSDYYNVPLETFMDIIKNAIRNGYTMSIGGDVSESGILRNYDVALVPTYDIPSEYIDEYARQFRFSNKTTTDDHGLHLMGYLEKDGKDWYLIKDSGSGGHNGNNFGYYFFHEDYVKLKIVDFMVHKDALGELLKKFKAN